MDINELAAKLEEEEDHSAFLEKLLRVLYGDGWEKLTIFDAQQWHKKHFASQQAVESDGKYRCHVCGVLEGEPHRSICSVGNGIYRR